MHVHLYMHLAHHGILQVQGPMSRTLTILLLHHSSISQVGDFPFVTECIFPLKLGKVEFGAKLVSPWLLVARVWTQIFPLVPSDVSWHSAAAAAAKLLQSCLTLCDPIDGSPPGFPVPGILQARTLEWVAIAFSNAWKWSRSVVFDSSRPHGLQPTRLLHPWDFPGKSTGVGCHCLLQSWHYWTQKRGVDQGCTEESLPRESVV